MATQKDSKEQIACFDNSGNPAESKIRSVIHNKPLQIWHGITNIWIMNLQGEILCTRRSSHVSGNPGKWQTYVGGHMRSGYTFIQTAIRELSEELGLSISEKNFTIFEEGRRDDTKHVYKNYVVLLDVSHSSLNFTDGEVDDAKWFSFEDYQKSREKDPSNWCNSTSSEQYDKISEIVKS